MGQSDGEPKYPSKNGSRHFISSGFSGSPRTDVSKGQSREQKAKARIKTQILASFSRKLELGDFAAWDRCWDSSHSIGSETCFGRVDALGIRAVNDDLSSLFGMLFVSDDG